MAEVDASIVMIWADTNQPGGQNVRVLGLPPVKFIDLDGLVITYKASQQ